MSVNRLLFTEEVRTKWVEALAGDYYNKKGKGRLRTDGEKETRYCCLGVLCDIFPKELGIDPHGRGVLNGKESYFGDYDSVQEETPLGIDPKELRDLVDYNDQDFRRDDTFENMIPYIIALTVTEVQCIHYQKGQK